MYGKIYCHLNQNNWFSQDNVPMGEVVSGNIFRQIYHDMKLQNQIFQAYVVFYFFQLYLLI